MGSAVEVSGNRAVSMTKMIILQRAEVEGVICDVSSYARHYDLWEKRSGRWGLVSRETIADKDRIDPVDPAQTARLDPELLARFPAEYRHLAYLQTTIGYAVDPDVPRLSGGTALGNPLPTPAETGWRASEPAKQPLQIYGRS